MDLKTAPLQKDLTASRLRKPSMPERATSVPAATPELIQSRPTPKFTPEVKSAELVSTPEVRRAELVATPTHKRTHAQINQTDSRPGL